MLPKPPEPLGWKRWTGWLFDQLYPPCCALCGVGLKGGRSLCDPCQGDLPRLKAPFCDRCGEAFPGRIDASFICPNCGTQKFSFAFARPALVRDERTLDMIHRFKYRREVHLASELGRLAALAFEDPRFAPALAQKWPLVPVPLHRARFQERYFNQAGEICRSLGALTGLPVVPALKRIRSTGHQTALSRSQRLQNLKGAFAMTRQGFRQVQQFAAGAVLVDDVFTTGSTIHECAKTLRRAGFQEVQAVTVMRG